MLIWHYVLRVMAVTVQIVSELPSALPHPFHTSLRSANHLQEKTRKLCGNLYTSRMVFFYVFAFGVAQSSCEGSVGMMGEWQ